MFVFPLKVGPVADGWFRCRAIKLSVGIIDVVSNCSGFSPVFCVCLFVCLFVCLLFFDLRRWTVLYQTIFDFVFFLPRLLCHPLNWFPLVIIYPFNSKPIYFSFFIINLFLFFLFFGVINWFIKLCFFYCRIYCSIFFCFVFSPDDKISKVVVQVWDASCPVV